MKVYAVNGSPRKQYSTGKLLEAFLRGAAEAGAETKMISLYDLNFNGCTECYACKRKNADTYGKCAYPDDITPLLQEISVADVIAFGSPVFFSDIIGQLRCFLERLFYPYTAFKKDSDRVIAPKKVRTAYFHTMNVTEEIAERAGYEQNLAVIHGWTQHVLGYRSEVLYSYNTYQYEDHSKYIADIWDWEDKRRWRDERFPLDLKEAYEIGRKLTLLSIE